MAARSARRRIRRSFTLVEMLVVVVIIGILAGLITGAAMIAMRAAKKAVLRTEVADLEAALHAYKERFGDYPPDNAASVNAHVARAFPRFRGAVPAQFQSVTPATALVVWLGGVDGNGYNSDATNPFGAGGTRIGPFYEFDKDRVGKVGAYTYQPRNGNANSQPIIYFRAGNGTYANTAVPGSNCKPCLDLRVGTTAYANAKSFQIRSPGLDGIHGKGQVFPDGTDYDQYQYDDLANFCEGTLGDRIP